MDIFTVNLEEGRPTVDAARRHLESALRTAKSRKLKLMKLIHGYGSSGSGGKIRTMTRKELQFQLQAGNIQMYIPGEQFSPFEDACRQAITLHFILTKDEDYQRANPGVTVVLL